jgi:hypothetical protein
MQGIIKKMNRILFLLPFLLWGCASSKCLENNEAFSRFIELHNVDENVLSSSSKEDIIEYKKQINSVGKIFSKICNSLEGNERLLFMDELSVAWGRERKGLIYLYEKDMVFYFNEENSKITVGQGYHNYNALKKTLDLVKPDFYKEANKLKEYFDKHIVYDAPYLKLAFIDLNKPKAADSLIGFTFGGDIDEELKQFNSK